MNIDSIKTLIFIQLATNRFKYQRRLYLSEISNSDSLNLQSVNPYLQMLERAKLNSSTNLSFLFLLKFDFLSKINSNDYQGCTKNFIKLNEFSS